MDNSAVKTRLNRSSPLLKATWDLSVDTMIVESLGTMRTFMLRRGIEFFTEQDNFGTRKEFIARIVEDNVEMKFESIVDYFLCDSADIFYFRPAGDNFQILYFPQDSYRAYRDGQVNLRVLSLYMASM